MKTNTKYKTQLGILAFAIVILVAISTVITFEGSSTKEFKVTLQNDAVADVIIITSTLYGNKDWKTIKQVVTAAAATTSNVGTLSGDLRNQLTSKGYSIVGFDIARQRTIVFNRKVR